MSLPTTFFIGRGGAGELPDLFAPSTRFFVSNENNGNDQYVLLSCSSVGGISLNSGISSSIGDVDKIISAPMSSTRVIYAAGYQPRFQVINAPSSGSLSIPATKSSAFNSSVQTFAVCGTGNFNQFVFFEVGTSNTTVDLYNVNNAWPNARSTTTTGIPAASSLVGAANASSALKMAGQNKIAFSHYNKVKFFNFSTALETVSQYGSILTLSDFSAYGWATLCYTSDPNIMVHVSYDGLSYRQSATVQFTFIDVSDANGPVKLGTDTVTGVETPSVTNENDMHSPWAQYVGGNCIAAADQDRLHIYKLNLKNYTVENSQQSYSYSGGYDTSNSISCVWGNEGVVAVIGNEVGDSARMKIETFGFDKSTGNFTQATNLGGYTQNLVSNFYHSSTATLYDLP